MRGRYVQGVFYDGSTFAPARYRTSTAVAVDQLVEAGVLSPLSE